MLCMCIYIFLFPFLIWTLGLKFCETFKLSFPLISYFGLSTTHFEESPTLQCFSVPNCLIFLICLLNLTCCLSTLKYIISFNCYILLVFLVRFWVAVISLLSNSVLITRWYLSNWLLFSWGFPADVFFVALLHLLD